MRQLYTMCILALVCLQQSYSQDPSFSQFYANRIYLNPALTGLEEGISLSGIYRMQWKNIDNGFESYAVSAEIQEPFIRSGFGLSLWRNVEGLAALSTTYIGLSYAYTIPMDRHQIHIGMHGRWVEKNVDWSKIVFSDQLDQVFGNVFPTTFEPGLDNTRYTDFDLGVVWRFQSDLKLGKRVFRNTRTSIGLSISHAPALFSRTEGDESLLGLDTRTSPRMTFHAGMIIPLIVINGGKKEIQLSPNIKYDRQGNNLLNQGNLQVATLGFYLIYEGVYLGTFYQNKYPVAGFKNTNAFIFMVGAQLKANKKSANKLVVGLSFDANTTGVGTASGGVYELTFRWTLAEGGSIFGRPGKSSSKRSLKCESFF